MTQEELDMLDEHIAIMKARKEGKVIEFRPIGGVEWYTMSEMMFFDFRNNIYRIKAETHLRPYATTDEVLDAIKEHGPYLKDGNTFRILKKFTMMENGTIVYSLSGMKDHGYSDTPQGLTFADGTPFGMEK